MTQTTGLSCTLLVLAGVELINEHSKSLCTYFLDQLHPSKLPILIWCECYMSLRVPKCRQRREKKVSASVVKAHSTLALWGFRKSICYCSLDELLDFLSMKVTTSQLYIIFCMHMLIPHFLEVLQIVRFPRCIMNIKWHLILYLYLSWYSRCKTFWS